MPQCPRCGTELVQSKEPVFNFRDRNFRGVAYVCPKCTDEAHEKIQALIKKNDIDGLHLFFANPEGYVPFVIHRSPTY